MLRAKIILEELNEENSSFFAVYIETKNANQLFLSESEDKLGTLAVAVPQPNLVGSTISSVLIGDKNVMIARLLAELLAHKTNKISLVSVYTKSVTEQRAHIFRKLMDRTLKKREETK